MKRLTAWLLMAVASAVVAGVSSAPAYAVDGVVLINQNTIINGLPGCPGPNPGGFPIVICQPGSYRLSGNLTVPANTDGIAINSDNVTLDLNGFSITGPETCTGLPVTSCTAANGNGILTEKDDVTVRNGSVTGFFVGVNLDGGGELVDGVHTKFDVGGINVLTGTIQLSSATQNFVGLELEGGGVIQGNTVLSNQDGIIVSGDSVIIGNALRLNATALFVLDTTYGSNSLRGNTTNINPSSVGAKSQNNNNCDGSVC